MKKVVLLIIFVGFLGFTPYYSFSQGANTFYGAFQAKRGPGQYRGAIFWINWDLDTDGRPGDNIADGSTRIVNTPSGITYTITITKNTTNNISSYTPGQYPYDDIKTAYNWYKATPTAGSTVQSWPGTGYNYSSSTLTNAYDNIYDAHHSVIGIYNSTSGQLVDFTITVTGFLPDGTTPVKIAGMVATGAESLAGSTGTNTNGINPTYGEYERFVALSTTPTPAQRWQAFTRFQNNIPLVAGYGTPSSTFNSVVDVNSNGTDITVHNPTSGTEGPGEVLWYSQGANSIRTYLKGGGHEAVAIGFVTSYDYGDAPESYGIVGHEVAANFGGGFPALATNNQVVSTMPLATMTQPRLIIGQLKDMGGLQWSTVDAQGDDIHDEDDEDGIDDPYATNIVAGTNNVTIPNINIINKFNTSTAHFKGWIDINQNGIFEQSERSADVLIPAAPSASTPYQGPNTLTWAALPGTFKAFTNYYSRVRITQNPPADGVDALGRDVKSLGIQYQGEVEDHIIRAAGVHVNGKVFLDNNKDGLKGTDEGLYQGSGLYAYALNSAGQVVVKADVVSGQYTLPDFFVGDSTSANVRVMISNQQYLLNEVIPAATTGSAISGFIMSGDDMTATNSNAAPGSNSKDFVAKINRVPTGGFGEVNFGMYDRALPVTFGAFEAKIVDGQLVIKWTTEKETNNDHFDIMISKDGTNFVKLATLQTKALNGNSDLPLDYDYSTSVQSNMGLLGLTILFLGICGIFLSRRNRSIFTMMVFIGMVTSALSCKKPEMDSLLNGKIFVKIVQVDKDGGRGETKVYTAVHE